MDGEEERGRVLMVLGKVDRKVGERRGGVEEEIERVGRSEVVYRMEAEKFIKRTKNASNGISEE